MMFKREEPPRPPRKVESMILEIPAGADLPVIETEIETATGTNNLNTVAERRAKRLLHRLQKGETLSKATQAERMTVAELKNPDNKVRESVQQLIGSHFLPPEARKQVVRAGLNKLFLDNVVSSDPASQKIALDAAKMIGSDPEVGLTTDNSGGVVINIGELGPVFENLKLAKVPEVSDGRPREDRIVEAEYEDLTAGGDQPDAIPDVSGGLASGSEPEALPSE